MTTKASADQVHEKVRAQFGATAAAYSVSAGHGDPTALNTLVALAAPKRN